MELPAWISLLPPIVAIACALLLRRVMLSLLGGVFLGALLVAGLDPLASVQIFLALVFDALTRGNNVFILGFAMVLGGLMRVMTRAGGFGALADRAVRFASSPRRGQVAAWGLGLGFFFDDYINTLIVGSSMRGIFDKLRLSREKLSFIVDATAAPVASLAPISGWIVVEVGYIGDQVTALGLSEDAYGLFIESIPLRFYPLLMLVLGITIALLGRDFGPMLRAERAARRGAPPNTGEDSESAEATEILAAAGEGSFSTAAVPIAVVVIGALGGLWWTGRSGALAAGLDPGDFVTVLSNANSSLALMGAAGAATVVAMVLAVQTGAFAWRGALECFVQGARGMWEVVAILLLAWALGGACRDLHTADALVALFGADFSVGYLSSAIFVVSAAVSFATGTSWGTMGILFPLAMPLAHALGPNDHALLVGTISAILAGSVFGDHCSPISDTTIMSALGAGCAQLDHVKTQLPYAIVVAVVAVLLGSLPTGLGLYGASVGLLLGACAIVLLVRVLGRHPGVGAPDEPH